MRSAHLKCLSKAKVKQRLWSNSIYRLRYWNSTLSPSKSIPAIKLQQHLPPAVLKLSPTTVKYVERRKQVATIPTACGMRRRVWGSRGAKWRWGPHIAYLNEVKVKRRWWSNSIYRLRYWNNVNGVQASSFSLKLQQHLPFTVCTEGCETAEEQSDDEVRTSQVPERSEGKTKGPSNSTYRLRYASQSVRQQRSKATMRPTHCKYLNEEKVKQKWSSNSTYRLRYWN